MRNVSATDASSRVRPWYRAGLQRASNGDVSRSLDCLNPLFQLASEKGTHHLSQGRERNKLFLFLGPLKKSFRIS